MGKGVKYEVAKVSQVYDCFGQYFGASDKFYGVNGADF